MKTQREHPTLAVVLIPGGYAPGPRGECYSVVVVVLLGWRRILIMRSTHRPMMKPPRMATRGAVSIFPFLLVVFWVSRPFCVAQGVSPELHLSDQQAQG